MKKLLFASILVLSTAAFAAEQEEEDPAIYGGIIEKPAKGYIALCDFQKKISGNDMLKFFVCTRECPIPLAYRHKPMQGKFDFAKVKEFIGDANVAVFFVDDPTLPMSLIAQEAKWGLINVAPLSKEGTKQFVINKRAEKLLTRVITVLLGGGNNVQVPFSAMRPIYSTADLDKMWSKAIAPLSLTQISAALPTLGLDVYEKATYEYACHMGWAPAPTNDVQKAIWDQVHALPSTPIKIQPEQNKVTE